MTLAYPYRYVPIIPTVLINGAEGIGTGWSTTIPNYNPRDVVDNLKRIINGEEPVTMHPWYRGFNGQIVEIPSKTAGKSYAIYGTVTQVCRLCWGQAAGPRAINVQCARKCALWLLT